MQGVRIGMANPSDKDNNTLLGDLEGMLGKGG